MEQRYEVGKMRSGHVQVGQVWMMEAPNRVVRVVEETTMELADDQKRIQQEPCFICEATIPIVPIKGHVGKREAEANIRLRKGIEAEAAFDPDDTPADYSWTEVWANRFLYGLTRQPGFPGLAVNDADTAPKFPILCCVKTIGRDQTRRKSSPIEGTRMGGTLIDPKDVPADLFGESNASEEPEAEAVGVRQEGGQVGAEAPLRQPGQAAQASTQEAQALPKTYPGLLKLAKARGVDISDIKGKGAVGKIRARLAVVAAQARRSA